MNKQKLATVLKDHHSISTQDVAELKKLAKNFPYSQVLHSLIAKGSYDNVLNSAQSDLHVAAMYATNRVVLKRLITSNASAVIKKQTDEPVATKKPSVKKTELKGKVESTTKEEPLSQDKGDALREQVLHDLELLVKSKEHYFEEENDYKIEETKPKGEKRKSSSRSKTGAKKEVKTKPTSKSKKETSKKDPKKKKVSKPKKTGKTKQSEIIDNFIEKEPRISKKVTKAEENITQKDLSAPSSEFNEDLASENLAQILIKQGKNDKAIDIYKKLIWKFPQKKAYFATQIEALKK